MKGKVMVFSKKGNTQKLADAIAKKLGMVCDQIPPSYDLTNDQIAFIGSGVYAGNADKKVITFCEQLTTAKVKNVALFNTSKTGDDKMESLAKIISDKGIKVVGVYSCKGKFLFSNGGCPTEADIAGAVKWAEGITQSLRQ